VSIHYPGTTATYAGFDDLLPRVYAGAPGVPETAAEHYLREAAIQFCEQSGWLQRDTRFPTACGMQVYPLFPADCERVMRVQRVWLGEKRFNDRYDDGIPFAVDAIDTPDVAVVIDNMLDGCEPLNARYIAVPVHNACVIDARLIEEWGRTLVYGALADLCMLPDQPFSSPALAAIYSRQFEDDVRRARVRRITGRKGGQGGVQSMTTGEPILI
jgi:hypothetical protein